MSANSSASALAAALRLCAYGLFFFPIKANSKSPPLVSSWESVATNDIAKINRWAVQFPNCNWGWAPSRSGHVVFDLDCKHGKDGKAELERLGSEYGFDIFNTLTIETPNGGLHLVTVGTTRSSASWIAPGIDVRARGGYAVAPGSILDGRAYKITKDVDLWEIPDAPPKLLELNDRKQNAPSPSPVSGIPFTPAQLTRMLAHLDPDCPRDEWRDIAAALHAAPCTDPQFDKCALFVRWSRGEVRHV